MVEIRSNHWPDVKVLGTEVKFKFMLTDDTSKYKIFRVANFLENDFLGPMSPLLFKVAHKVTAPLPLACTSRSAWPGNCLSQPCPGKLGNKYC